MIIAAVNQEYITGVHEEYVVTGNFALMKCSIPSFVADLITVISWQDNTGKVYAPNPLNYGTVEPLFSLKKVVKHLNSLMAPCLRKMLNHVLYKNQPFSLFTQLLINSI